MKRLGIMGGTFDPVHNAHLELARCAAEHYGLEKVLFIVSPNPPHKTPITDVQDRVNMVSLAIGGNKLFELSTIEIDRGGVSYTLDTVKQLREIYGEDCKLFLILGSDEAGSFMHWYRPQEIAKMAKVVCAKRGGFNEVAELAEVFYMPKAEISSTEIREKIREHKCVKGLLPDVVADYIIKKRLYGGTV